MLLTAVPEAAIHEDGHTPDGEDHVGTNAPTPYLNWMIDSESQASAVQLGAEPALWNRASSAIRAHTRRDGRASWGRSRISRGHVPILAILASDRRA